ncbi:uncharacterized protein [Palaemon carinicauda]|uniref:uncharacterized protein n=1 Tax=Palaemon carinicauda TaxID=392227 RepID=UPI0035B59A39
MQTTTPDSGCGEEMYGQLSVAKKHISSHSSNLLIDVAHRQLVNADSYSSTPLQPAPFDFALHIIVPTDAYTHLLTSYLEVFHPKHHQMHTVPDKDSNYDLIDTMGPQVFARFRRLAPDHLCLNMQTEPDHCPLPNITNLNSYLDKVKVFSTLDLLNGEEHLRHVRILFDCLQQNGLLIWYDKCSFGANEVSFLGHHITPKGVHPSLKR